MPHNREEIVWRADPFKRPHVALDGKGPQWILEASDGTKWRIYHIRYVDGKARRSTSDEATHRVFESPSGELRRRELASRERRDMKGSLVERQLQLAIRIERQRPPDPAPRAKGWTRVNDGWDTFRQTRWGPPTE